ncbi:MAG: class I SAM-dependent methyltransferase [Actinomycetota bacterium]
MAGASTIDTLRHEVEQLQWYHTLELAPGLLTPGWFDTRPALDKIGFPADLTGKRCLDVGTFDGFWAFEMEHRNASEVVAVDLLDPRRWDWPMKRSDATIEEIGKMKAGGRGFEIAREALGSKVERHAMSVYDLDPADLGTFDFVYVGSLLLHLRDPVRALDAVRTVCTGRLLLVDAIDLPLTLALPRRPVAGFDGIGRPWWWKPNVAGLSRMTTSAGFRVQGRPTRFFMEPGAGQDVGQVRPGMLLSRAGREAAVTAWRGDPHAAVSAVPI